MTDDELDVDARGTRDDGRRYPMTRAASYPARVTGARPFQATTTLDELLSRPPGLERAHVAEPGFALLYARVSGGDDSPPRVLTLADIVADMPGQGALTRLLERLDRDWPGVAVRFESVPHERLAGFLERHGFVRAGTAFWRYPGRR